MASKVLTLGVRWGPWRAGSGACGTAGDQCGDQWFARCLPRSGGVLTQLGSTARNVQMLIPVQQPHIKLRILSRSPKAVAYKTNDAATPFTFVSQVLILPCNDIDANAPTILAEDDLE